MGDLEIHVIEAVGLNDVFGQSRSVEEWVALREKFRREGKYDLADKIRDKLIAQGIELRDAPEGTRKRPVRVYEPYVEPTGDQIHGAVEEYTGDTYDEYHRDKSGMKNG